MVIYPFAFEDRNHQLFPNNIISCVNVSGTKVLMLEAVNTRCEKLEENWEVWEAGGRLRVKSVLKMVRDERVGRISVASRIENIGIEVDEEGFLNQT